MGELMCWEWENNPGKLVFIFASNVLGSLSKWTSWGKFSGKEKKIVQCGVNLRIYPPPPNLFVRINQKINLPKSK